MLGFSDVDGSIKNIISDESMLTRIIKDLVGLAIYNFYDVIDFYVGNFDVDNA